MPDQFVRSDVRIFLDRINNQPGARWHEVTPSHMRSAMTEMARTADVERGELAVVRDFELPGPAGLLGARLYDARAERSPAPVMVYFHGGGFVVGGLELHDAFCAEAARVLDLPIVSVDYRVAPEAKWPAAPDDCEAAARWVAGSPPELGIGVTSLILAGDSACQSARKTDPLSASKIDPPCDVEIRA